jgi:hypothetical protein
MAAARATPEAVSVQVYHHVARAPISGGFPPREALPSRSATPNTAAGPGDGAHTVHGRSGEAMGLQEMLQPPAARLRPAAMHKGHW